MGTLGPMANIRLKIYNLWYTSRGQQGQILGHRDPWQTPSYKFKIRGTPAEASKAKNGDTGNHGKHQNENLKFLVHRQRPSRAKMGTLEPMGNIRLRI